MGKQFELFEAEERQWIDRLWQSMPPKARGEVIGILAQMGKYLLQAEKAAQKSEEVRDES